MSWNGATGVVRWRALGGRRRHRLHLVAVAAKRGFETALVVGRHRYLQIEAIGRSGQVLGRTRVVRAG